MRDNEFDRDSDFEYEWLSWQKPVGCEKLSCDDMSCAVCTGWSEDHLAEIEAEEARLEAIFDDPGWADDSPASDCLNCSESFGSQSAREAHFNLNQCPATEFIPWVINGQVRTPTWMVTA